MRLKEMPFRSFQLRPKLAQQVLRHVMETEHSMEIDDSIVSQEILSEIKVQAADTRLILNEFEMSDDQGLLKACESDAVSVLRSRLKELKTAIDKTDAQSGCIVSRPIRMQVARIVVIGAFERNQALIDRAIEMLQLAAATFKKEEKTGRDWIFAANIAIRSDSISFLKRLAKAKDEKFQTVMWFEHLLNESAKAIVSMGHIFSKPACVAADIEF